MTLDEEARAALIAYCIAHDAWKKAPDGQLKVDAKRLRGQLHGELLDLGRLLVLKEK